MDGKRLWIGNLDPRINEFQLLKLLQKYGSIEKFDLLFHRNGPLAGQPRGYAFVTYISELQAKTAKEALHNKLVGNRRISVTVANSMPVEKSDKDRPEFDVPALAGAKKTMKISRKTQIDAIEAQLKMLEQKSNELEINKTVATEIPVIDRLNNTSTTATAGDTTAKDTRNSTSSSVKSYNHHFSSSSSSAGKNYFKPYRLKK